MRKEREEGALTAAPERRGYNSYYYHKCILAVYSDGRAVSL